MHENDITKSSGNVFVDLGFEPGEAAVMLIRVEVTSFIVKQIEKEGWTPTESARQLGITQLQVAQIIGRKLEDVSLDTLWMIAVRSGLDLQLKLADKY